MNAGTSYAGQYIQLDNDIDLNGQVWTAIGGTAWNEKSDIFSGTFNGNDHEITGFYASTNEDVRYLFGYVENGTVKNLTLSGAQEGYSGALVYSNTDGLVDSCICNTNVVMCAGVVVCNMGTVSNCVNNGDVSSSAQGVGGVVGVNYDTVINCVNNGTINASNYYVGGVVGINKSNSTYITASVKNCYNTGTVTASGTCTGGVVGQSAAGAEAGIATVLVEGCFNTGAVSGDETIVGGVVGRNVTSYEDSNATVENCYNTGAVSGNDSEVGGVVGTNSDVVNRCYNTGSVISLGSQVGGVVGNSRGSTISNCYNTGFVSGKVYVGGIAGYHLDNSAYPSECFADPVVQYCYNTGVVQGSTMMIAGIVGVANAFPTIEYCVSLGHMLTGAEYVARIVGSSTMVLRRKTMAGQA